MDARAPGSLAGIPASLRGEVARCRNRSRDRPARIEAPGPGRESVWDYPRPPRVEAVAARVRVEFGGLVLADSRAARRVLETSSPPVFYLPADDVRTEWLARSDNATLCEWKGIARHWSIRVGPRASEDVAWSYPDPFPGYEEVRDHLAFYPGRVDACYVGDQRVQPQPGGYYGGWVTAEITGPFKGEPGSENW